MIKLNSYFIVNQLHLLVPTNISLSNKDVSNILIFLWKWYNFWKTIYFYLLFIYNFYCRIFVLSTVNNYHLLIIILTGNFSIFIIDIVRLIFWLYQGSNLLRNLYGKNLMWIVFWQAQVFPLKKISH